MCLLQLDLTNWSTRRGHMRKCSLTYWWAHLDPMQQRAGDGVRDPIDVRPVRGGPVGQRTAGQRDAAAHSHPGAPAAIGRNRDLDHAHPAARPAHGEPDARADALGPADRASGGWRQSGRRSGGAGVHLTAADVHSPLRALSLQVGRAAGLRPERPGQPLYGYGGCGPDRLKFQYAAASYMYYTSDKVSRVGFDWMSWGPGALTGREGSNGADPVPA